MQEDMFKSAATMMDGQLSKLVLGQTSSAGGTPGGQEEEVRQGICRADALQFDQTVNFLTVKSY